MVTDGTPKFGIDEKLLPTKSPTRWRYLFGPQIAHWLERSTEIVPLRQVPIETRRWIRCASDERAAQTVVNGKPAYRFSERIGQSVVDWVSKNCYLYEGEMGGKPMIVEDWQYEYFMQTFGWLWAHPTYKEWVRRFQQVSVWIAKKNAKSPTLAATGVYIFCGEGEMGQKCYSIARDGEQAKISHMHAVNMIQQSPTLSPDCQIFKNTWDIVHRPTRSVYKIVHAKNANSQEGLNGSIFIDETHVIGNDIVDVIKRAGISRREPLHVEMSTAGDISNDYGKSRFDYGISNAAIEFPEAWNPNFLCINFSVSQQLPASTFQSEREVLKLAVKANPGFGRLFTKENILSDFRTSRQSPPELAQFKRYRLGIWLSGGVNWLDYSKWQACAHPNPPEISRLKKYPLAMGVDLSHTRDTTSVVLEFGLTDPDNPGNLIPYFVPYFWIPRSSVDRYRKFFNFEKWSKHVTIVEEEAIQTEAIADFVHEIYTDGYDVRGLGFDPHHSSIFINRLLKVHGWSENMLREIPTTIRYMSGPTKDLENMIINQQMYHSNHPVMNWQIGHVQVICDQTDHYMPAKPGKFRAKGGGTDDPRKIDGVIAAVNANAVSTDNEIGFRNNSGLVLI